MVVLERVPVHGGVRQHAVERGDAAYIVMVPAWLWPYIAMAYVAMARMMMAYIVMA